MIPPGPAAGVIRYQPPQNRKPAAWYAPLTLSEQQKLRANLYSAVNKAYKLCSWSAPSIELWSLARGMLTEVADLHLDLCHAPLPGTSHV